jgi:hypothetical protein
VQSLLEQIRNPNVKLRKVQTNDSRSNDVFTLEQNKPSNDKPLTIAEEMKQRMLRRQAAISGKQDQLEQKRDRERFAKPVEVLKAQEVNPALHPSPSPPPPPPPPISEPDSPRRNILPSVDMSDDEDGGNDVRRPVNHDSGDDENDLLAQIRNIKKKQDASGSVRRATPPPTKVEEPKSTPAVSLESVSLI